MGVRRREGKGELENVLQTKQGFQGPSLRKSLHVGVFPGDGTAKERKLLTFINNTDAGPSESTDASHSLSSLFQTILASNHPTGRADWDF